MAEFIHFFEAGIRTRCNKRAYPLRITWFWDEVTCPECISFSPFLAEHHPLTDSQGDSKYRICTKCAIHHYENCGTCFGFGVYTHTAVDGIIPVNAHAACTQEFSGETRACPECLSTSEGLHPLPTLPTIEFQVGGMKE